MSVNRKKKQPGGVQAEARAFSIRAAKRLMTQAQRSSKAAREANTAWIAAVQRHLERFPLSEDLQQQLIAHVVSGSFLCCAAGFERLAFLHDSIWATVINAWAYEALGCSDRHKDPSQCADNAMRMKKFLEKPRASVLE